MSQLEAKSSQCLGNIQLPMKFVKMSISESPHPRSNLVSLR